MKLPRSNARCGFILKVALLALLATLSGCGPRPTDAKPSIEFSVRFNAPPGVLSERSRSFDTLRAGIEIGTSRDGSSSQKKPSKCISNTSWKSWAPVIALRQSRLPFAAVSSSCEAGSIRIGAPLLVSPTHVEFARPLADDPPGCDCSDRHCVPRPWRVFA